MSITWIEDPGHAWLRVNVDEYTDAIDSGTGYGYQVGRDIFLEEDCEAGHFLARHPEIDPTRIPVHRVRDFNRNQRHNVRKWEPFAVLDERLG